MWPQVLPVAVAAALVEVAMPVVSGAGIYNPSPTTTGRHCVLALPASSPCSDADGHQECGRSVWI
jgi:hypothetical protein